MRKKVIVFISQSLDGFIADNDGRVDWIVGNKREYTGDYGYNEFLARIDTVILGSRTYLQIRKELSPQVWVYENLQSFVLSSKDCVDTPNTQCVRGNIAALIQGLKEQKGKDIWICGGAEVIAQCVRENLIDEYHIATIPIVLGGGIRLFGTQRFALELAYVKSENGVILSIHTPKSLES